MSRSRAILCFCAASCLVTLLVGTWITGEGLLPAGLQARAPFPLLVIFAICIAAALSFCLVMLISAAFSWLSLGGMILLLLAGRRESTMKWTARFKANERRLGHIMADWIPFAKAPKHDAR